MEQFSDQLTFGSHAWDFFAGQSAWDVSFTPAKTRYVRLVIRQVTNGGQGDALAQGYGGQGNAPQVTLSEIGVYAK